MANSTSRTSARVRKAARDHQKSNGTTYREALSAVKSPTQPRRVLHVLATDVHGNPYVGPALEFPYESIVPFATWYEPDERGGVVGTQGSGININEMVERVLAHRAAGVAHTAVTGNVASGKTEFAKRVSKGLLSLGDSEVTVIVSEDASVPKYSAYKSHQGLTPATEIPALVDTLLPERAGVLRESGFRSWAESRESGSNALPFVLVILDHMDYSPSLLEVADLIGMRGRELGVGLLAVKIDISGDSFSRNVTATLNATRHEFHAWELTDATSTSFDVTYAQPGS